MACPADADRRVRAAASNAQYRRRADHYDDELAPFEPWRSHAIDLLQLLPRQSVLDVGCGTGLSFGGLLRCVGRQGRVVGIDPSPEMLLKARERVGAHRWRNVALVEAAAWEAPLDGPADAALLHFTHDVLRDDRSLDHILAHVKPGGRVVATGLQWAPLWLWPVNAFVLGAALYSVTTLDGLARPWDKLESRLRGVRVQTGLLGGIYTVCGTV